MLGTALASSLIGVPNVPTVSAVPAYQEQQAREQLNIYRNHGIRFEYPIDGAIKEKGIIVGGSSEADCRQGEVSVKSVSSELYVIWLMTNHKYVPLLPLLDKESLVLDGEKMNFLSKETPVQTRHGEFRTTEMSFTGTKEDRQLNGIMQITQSDGISRNDTNYLVVFISPSSREGMLTDYRKFTRSFETYPCD